MGVWDSIRLNYGSLYAVAESLRKKGLVKASETRREGNRPERTVYTLTGEGEHAMRGWLAEMLRDPQPQFTGFEAALPLMGALPPDVEDMLRQRLEALAKESARQKGLRAMLPDGFPELFTVEGDYAGHLREAETAFVRVPRRQDLLAPPRRPRGMGPHARAPRSGARRRGPPAEARRGVPRDFRLEPPRRRVAAPLHSSDPRPTAIDRGSRNRVAHDPGSQLQG